VDPPEIGTVERWAWDYVHADRWEDKLAPPPPPTRWEIAPPPRRLIAPGRGAGFRVAAHGERSTGKSELRSAERRSRLIHSFLHHELQAAELMAWALLAFPETPIELRRGLVRIVTDEVRHMGHYRDYLASRSIAPGDLHVRDWFWERVPSCPDAASFLATMGIGFEGGNLDHAARFAARFRAAGDEEAADLEDLVGREEVAHVRFALRWFRTLTTPDAPKDTPADAEDFARFRLALPAPLSPQVMQGAPIARDARGRAGMGEAFVDALEAALHAEAPPR
jgi:uncharacterized ferritin-like protein (DUF455 family)